MRRDLHVLREETREVIICGKNIPGLGSRYRDPKMGSMCLACLRKKRGNVWLEQSRGDSGRRERFGAPW